ncbi:MAG: hypothetical protein QS748_13790 [Candidatus Endonucleobacter bathymodioli]|uniref:Beta-ketoacyl-[acyl-carrier-protein] synthase III N-terminal domain-containing protein n=1 Tax=Candidatus Endonucleibacter bathymodioli TaxID=539814 RepID=A0AA90NP28_9GAMM|nr:hypothetical protein [Candidatus Endonucleobacter bathymodioli]
MSKYRAHLKIRFSRAASLITAAANRRALVIGADQFSIITDWLRRDCAFFGDGGGAVVVEASNSEEAFYYARLFSETTNTDNFTVFPEDKHFTMSGRAVYKTGSKALPRAINPVLSERYTVDDIACVILYQPSMKFWRVGY